jgi:hypothetical protein
MGYRKQTLRDVGMSWKRRKDQNCLSLESDNVVPKPEGKKAKCKSLRYFTYEVKNLSNIEALENKWRKEMNKLRISDIFCSHGSECKDEYLLAHWTVPSGRSLPTSHMRLPPLPSE